MHEQHERVTVTARVAALVRTVGLGIDGRRGLSGTQITTIAAWRTRVEPLEITIARAQAVRLAKRPTVLDEELHANQATLATLIGRTPAADRPSCPALAQ